MTATTTTLMESDTTNDHSSSSNILSLRMQFQSQHKPVDLLEGGGVSMRSVGKKSFRKSVLNSNNNSSANFYAAAGGSSSIELSNKISVSRGEFSDGNHDLQQQEEENSF